MSGSPGGLSCYLFFLLVPFLGMFETFVWIAVILYAKWEQWMRLCASCVSFPVFHGIPGGFQLWGWSLPSTLLLTGSWTLIIVLLALEACQKLPTVFHFASQSLHLNWQSLKGKPEPHVRLESLLFPSLQRPRSSSPAHLAALTRHLRSSLPRGCPSPDFSASCLLPRIGLYPKGKSCPQNIGLFSV